MEINIHNQTFILDKNRAIYNPENHILIIADIHLGKTTHFRKHGIAVPMEIAMNDLNRLSILIKKYTPRKIVIAGDFFHAEANSEINLFRDWQSKYNSTKFILIRGNHDRLNKSIYNELNIQLVRDTLYYDEFQITHEPNECPTELTICGHIHPGVKLKMKTKERLRLPCFLVQKNQIILPAFSEFTGLDTSLQNTGINYAITDTEVVII